MVRRRNPSVIEGSEGEMDNQIESEEEIHEKRPRRFQTGPVNRQAQGDSESSARPQTVHATRGERFPSLRRKFAGQCPRRVADPNADEPASDDDGKKDDVVALPPDDAPLIRDLVLHKAKARRNPNEPQMDYSAGSNSLLQYIRYENPMKWARDNRIDGHRFWNLFHVDFYNSVIMTKKHQPIIKQRSINWAECEQMRDKEMTRALRACEAKGMKNIMLFSYDWNDEVIAQFYSTLWVKLSSDDLGAYAYPYMNFNIEGQWYKVSYRRFAHILGFTDSEIHPDRRCIHNYSLPPRAEVIDMHVVPTDDMWKTTNLQGYYRYLNSMFRATLIPKGGNQVNVHGESHVLLYFMKPNKNFRINVFDMIWKEIIHASWNTSKGCVHAPFIMKMIEVVSQTYFQKDSKHVKYTPYWIDPNNPAGRSKRAPTSAEPGASSSSSEEPAPAPPLHPSSSRAAAASRPMSRGDRGKQGGFKALLKKGFNAMFAIYRENSIHTAELVRRTMELDQNFRRHVAGQPLLPVRPYNPPPPMADTLDQWHQQTYGVPFSASDQEISEDEPVTPPAASASVPPPTPPAASASVPPPPASAPDLGTYFFGDPSGGHGPYGGW
jgi:hypothetical protein